MEEKARLLDIFKFVKSDPLKNRRTCIHKLANTNLSAVFTLEKVEGNPTEERA